MYLWLKVDQSSTLILRGLQLLRHLNMSSLELYRRSSIGMALTDALDEMVTARELTPTIAMRILLEFDRCIVKELELLKQKTTFGAHVHTYRFCDNVWTFILENVKFKATNYSGIVEEIHADKVKVVACDSKILERK
ncbi:unnamed protein product [Bathycoccus prasinos]